MGDEFDEANAHIKQATSHAVNDTYSLACAMWLQANVLGRQDRLQDAKSEALGALAVFKKLGAATDAENCKGLLQELDEK
jgi:hypothetical protein